MQPTFRANVDKMNQMPKKYIVHGVTRGKHFTLKKFWTRISNFRNFLKKILKKCLNKIREKYQNNLSKNLGPE